MSDDYQALQRKVKQLMLDNGKLSLQNGRLAKRIRELEAKIKRLKKTKE